MAAVRAREGGSILSDLSGLFSMAAGDPIGHQMVSGQPDERFAPKNRKRLLEPYAEFSQRLDQSIAFFRGSSRPGPEEF